VSESSETSGLLLGQPRGRLHRIYGAVVGVCVSSGAVVVGVGVAEGVVVVVVGGVVVVGVCVSSGAVVVGVVVGVGDELIVVVSGSVTSEGFVEVDMRMPPSGDIVHVPFSGQRFATSPNPEPPVSMYQLDSSEGS
jgi:hypothetical protein